MPSIRHFGPQLLALLGGLAFAGCQWLVFAYAPTEANMGLVQKIFYIHLPLAWWALLSFFVVFVASVVYLLKRSPGADRLCAAAAEVGVLLCGLALITGMLWARRSWGVWWTWDPRLTTTLIMWFVYAGYLVLRGLDLPPQQGPCLCRGGGGGLPGCAAGLYLGPHLAFHPSGGLCLRRGRAGAGNEIHGHCLCGLFRPVVGWSGLAPQVPA